MKVLPQASAIGAIHIGTMNGKLKGVMPAVTPSGMRWLQWSMPPPMPCECWPLSSLRDAAGKFDDLQPALHLAQGIGQGLAVLGGDQCGDVPWRIFSTRSRKAKHHPGAALRRRRAPFDKCGLRRCHGAIDVGAFGQRHRACDAALRRGEHLAATGAAPGVCLAADPVDDEIGGIDEFQGHGYLGTWHGRPYIAA
jgi:hypothetical protein